MKLNSPNSIALFVGGALGALVAIIVLIVGVITKNVSLLGIVISGISSFVLAYLILYYTLQIFINKRIRIIYRTIKNYKLADSAHEEFDMNEDVIGEVQREVIGWAQMNKKKIAQLNEQESFRREYIGNLAHELKTPIFSIQGYILTLLEGGLEDTSINRKFLERASKGVDRITHIIEDLDTITRLEDNRLHLEFEKSDVVSLAQEVMDSFEMKAQDRNIKLQFNEPYKGINVEMDRSAIGQVVTNLVNNSINYGKSEGGMTEIRFHNMEDRVLVEVSDNGIGIPEEHLPRLFERFYRVDKSRNRNEGGTGLGLAIVKHIIESHGQTINVRSTLGVGSTFSFTLKKA